MLVVGSVRGIHTAFNVARRGLQSTECMRHVAFKRWSHRREESNKLRRTPKTRPGSERTYARCDDGEYTTPLGRVHSRVTARGKERRQPHKTEGRDTRLIRQLRSHHCGRTYAHPRLGFRGNEVYAKCSRHHRKLILFQKERSRRTQPLEKIPLFLR